MHHTRLPKRRHFAKSSEALRQSSNYSLNYRNIETINLLACALNQTLWYTLIWLTTGLSGHKLGPRERLRLEFSCLAKNTYILSSRVTFCFSNFYIRHSAGSGAIYHASRRYRADVENAAKSDHTLRSRESAIPAIRSWLLTVVTRILILVLSLFIAD